MSAGLRGIYELQGVWLAPGSAIVVVDVPRQVEGGRGVVRRPQYDHIEPTRRGSLSAPLIDIGETYERTRRAEREAVPA